MIRHDSASVRAARLLKSAARHLETIDPTPILGDAIADAVELSGGFAPLLPQFAESAPGSLSLVVQPGGTTEDRVSLSKGATRRAVAQHFGRAAARWLDSRTEPATDVVDQAFFGCSVDRDGLAEGVVGFDLPEGHTDLLPPSLARTARLAVALLPGARVLSTMVRCGRSSGSQQVTIEPTTDLPLTSLKPLMDEVGLGHQHGSLMSAAGFLLGARFTLPGHSARLSLRPIRTGMELRLDVILDSIPDPPPQLMSLLRLWMTERPRSVNGLDRWLSAFNPEGYPHAGDVTVLSVWVRPDVPARVALFLRPTALAPATHPEGEEHAVVASSPWS